ncbi:MAG TPA: LCP family protein, partial [Beutenbergiaceae bacterium]|nr:LCP family protein [Beutenbergiaceae bacterium]
MTIAHAAPRKRKKGKIFFILLAIVLVLAAATAAIYTLSLGRSFDQGRTVVEDVFPDEGSRPEAPEAGSDADKAQNILLLGSDTRGEISDEIDKVTGTRADAIMVVHIPAERDQVDVMSIMRDNWVPIDGHGHAKINAALAYGGVPLMVSTVE